MAAKISIDTALRSIDTLPTGELHYSYSGDERGVFDEDDQLIAERSQHPKAGLRQNDVAKSYEPPHADGSRSFPLTLAYGFNTTAQYLY